MYIRFITEFKNEDAVIKTGVFQALGYLLRTKQTFEYDEILLKEIRAWFNQHLEKPTRFSKSRRNNASSVALSWFKSSSTEHIRRMYELKAVLDKYNIVVDVVKRGRPGYIIYEDEFQVATLPYKLDKNVVK